MSLLHHALDCPKLSSHRSELITVVTGCPQLGGSSLQRLRFIISQAGFSLAEYNTWAWSTVMFDFKVCMQIKSV